MKHQPKEQRHDCLTCENCLSIADGVALCDVPSIDLQSLDDVNKHGCDAYYPV